MSLAWGVVLLARYHLAFGALHWEHPCPGGTAVLAGRNPIPWVLSCSALLWHRVFLPAETVPAAAKIPQCDGSCQGGEEAQAGREPGMTSTRAQEEQHEGAAMSKPVLVVICRG